MPHISVLLRSLLSLQPVVPALYLPKTHPMTAAQPPRRRPLTIVVAAALLALEGLIGLAYAAIEVGQVRMSRAAVGVGVAILMAGFGLLLLAGGARRVPGQAMEQGTGRGYPADLAPDRLELPRRCDHVGVGSPGRIGDRRSGRCAAPAVDRGLRRAACR